jgi:hypothetical protein
MSFIEKWLKSIWEENMGLLDWLAGKHMPIPYELQIKLIQERMDQDERERWNQLSAMWLSIDDIKRQAEQDNARAWLRFKAYQDKLKEKYLTEDERANGNS